MSCTSAVASHQVVTGVQEAVHDPPISMQMSRERVATAKLNEAISRVGDVEGKYSCPIGRNVLRGAGKYSRAYGVTSQSIRVRFTNWRDGDDERCLMDDVRVYIAPDDTVEQIAKTVRRVIMTANPQ